MIDQGYLTELSRTVFEDTDLRVLQGFRLADNDRAHIAELLRYMNPAPDTGWVDIGCGFGEPARLMRELRPDLKFHLVNNNKFQLERTPEEFPRSYADMHSLPFADKTFDGAMFLYSLCHADDVYKAIEEAARVVRPGGGLFVFDYVRTKGDDWLSLHYLASRFFGFGALWYMCQAIGWKFGGCIAPEGDDTMFRDVFTDQELYDRIFDDLVPVVWWATRR